MPRASGYIYSRVAKCMEEQLDIFAEHVARRLLGVQEPTVHEIHGVEIEWDAPHHPNCRCVVEVTSKDSSGVREFVPTTKNELSISELRPSATYEFRARLHGER